MDVDHVLSLHLSRASVPVYEPSDRDLDAGHVGNDPELTEKGQRLEEK